MSSRNSSAWSKRSPPVWNRSSISSSGRSMARQKFSHCGALATPMLTQPSWHGTGPNGLNDSACMLPARRLMTPWWVYSVTVH